MCTILVSIDWKIATRYFLGLLIVVFVIYLIYCILIKLRNRIHDLNRTEKVQITGLITKVVDDPFPMINPHGHIYNSPVYLDEKGQPIVGHNYWIIVQSKDIAYLINLTKKLFDDIAVNFEAGARFIKINCNKLMHNGKLDGEEIVDF